MRKLCTRVYYHDWPNTPHSLSSIRAYENNRETRIHEQKNDVS